MENTNKSCNYDEWFKGQVKLAQNSSRIPLSLEQSSANLALKKTAKLKG